MTKNECLIKAQEELALLRAENRRAEERRREELAEKLPEYARLEAELSGTMARAVSAIAAGTGSGGSVSGMIERISGENLAIQEKMKALLKENGYAEDYAEPIYSCAKCRDRGTVDGDWCECLKKRAHRIAAKELNDRSPLSLCSFEGFELSVYSDVPEKTGEKSPRQLMKENFDKCVTFAENFSGREKGFFMIGGTGLGKTHLSLAVASRVIERDFSVIYNSVPELLRTIDIEQFGKSSDETMTELGCCDLLILDDLGAENKSERTVSLLYEIINGRLSRSLPLIVNTNLSANELLSRYGDRIFSRLLSLNYLEFVGNDQRLK